MGNKQSQPPMQATWKIAAETMIMTRRGPRRVDTIKPHEIVEFSTNMGWVKAKRGPYLYATLTNIEISDGTKIMLSPGTQISDDGLNIGAIVNSYENFEYDPVSPTRFAHTTRAARGALPTSPKTSPPRFFARIPSDAPTTIDFSNDRDWYRIGYVAGSKSLKNSSINIEYPEDEETAANFINGWSDAQSGFLTGNYNEIMALYYMLRLAKTTNIIVEKMFENRYKIIASNYKHAGDNVKWCVHLSRRSRHIVNTYPVKKVKCCSFEFFDYDDQTAYIDIGPATITINDTMFSEVTSFVRGISEANTPVSSAESKSIDSNDDLTGRDSPESQISQSSAASQSGEINQSMPQSTPQSAPQNALNSIPHSGSFVNYDFPQIISV